MDTWLQALGPGGLADADPYTQQLHVGGNPEQVPDPHRAWAEDHLVPKGGLAEGQAMVRQHRLDVEQLASSVASRLGWSDEWEKGWPEGGVELRGVEPFRDEVSKRRGLRATEYIVKNTAIGVERGYVMADDVASAFVSKAFQRCSKEVKDELARRVGHDLTHAWRALACSYMADYCAGVRPWTVHWCNGCVFCLV